MNKAERRKEKEVEELRISLRNIKWAKTIIENPNHCKEQVEACKERLRISLLGQKEKSLR